MRRSVLMIIIGILMLISIVPMFMFNKSGICFSCLFSVLLVFFGIAILVNGIITLSRNMKKDNTGVEADNDKLNLKSLIEPVFWASDATKRIARNRRRSSAMLSGIILSSLIIGSVFIFTEAMQEDFYNDFVQNIPFELTFSPREQGTEEDLWDLADRIGDDRRIESTTVIGGIHLMDMEQGDASYDEESNTEFYLRFNTQVNFSSEGEKNTYMMYEGNPVFVREDFSETTIYDKIFRDGLEGSFDLNPEKNNTVIPRSMANKMYLELGDKIEVLEIRLDTFSWSKDPADPSTDDGRFSFQLRNVTIVGIYNENDDEGGGSGPFFFNTEVLDRYDPGMKEKMEEVHLFVLAVKIDPSEFNTGNMEKMTSEVDDLRRDIERESDHEVRGVNNIGGVVFVLNVIRYVLIVVDFLLILPVVILSIYFLIFGLDLSLEERKREVAILKVQGASPRQIFRIISMETFMLFIFGLAIGYFLSMVTGWFIMSSIGFMTFDLSLDYLFEFFGYHREALLASTLIVGMIVLISVFFKARRFIKQEVTEGVQRTSKKTRSIIISYFIAIPLLIFGTISAVREILDVVFDVRSIGNFSLSLGEGWDVFLFTFLGTLALWIGGALSGPIIAQWLALRTERFFLKLFFLKDVALIIKSGLKRRGDTGKLVLIIVLTLSVATLASVQGLTDQMNSERIIEYEVGADFQVILSEGADNKTLLENIEGVNKAMVIPFDRVIIEYRDILIVGIDSDEASFFKWHDDSFNGISPSDALSKLEENKMKNGVFFGEDLAREMNIKKGETFQLKIPRENHIAGEPATVSISSVLLGTYDHFPGEVDRSSIVCDHSTLLKIRSLKHDHDLDLERSVPVIDRDPEKAFQDNSPDHGVIGSPFTFEIEVTDPDGTAGVSVQWSHDDLGGNLSLIDFEGSYYGLVDLNVTLDDLEYTVFVEDLLGNVASGQMQTIKVVNLFYENRLYDLGNDVAYTKETYDFRISLGEDIDIEGMYVLWSHGNLNGNITLVEDGDYYIGSLYLDESNEDLVYSLGLLVPEANLNSTIYLLDKDDDIPSAEVRKGLDRISNIDEYRDLEQEKADIVDQINFGIPGLLTMMFVASIIAVFTSAFAFSSIIIKRRMREFAVLQTVGATRWQVYKIAIGENSLVMMISVVMGLLVGIGLSYLMNPFFEGLGIILDIGSQGLTRLVFFPWPVILSISLAIFLGMLLAVAVSAVSAARQDLAVSTRVV